MAKTDHVTVSDLDVVVDNISALRLLIEKNKKKGVTTKIRKHVGPNGYPTVDLIGNAKNVKKVLKSMGYDDIIEEME